MPFNSTAFHDSPTDGHVQEEDSSHASTPSYATPLPTGKSVGWDSTAQSNLGVRMVQSFSVLYSLCTCAESSLDCCFCSQDGTSASPQLDGSSSPVASPVAKACSCCIACLSLGSSFFTHFFCFFCTTSVRRMEPVHHHNWTTLLVQSPCPSQRHVVVGITCLSLGSSFSLTSFVSYVPPGE